MKEKYSNIICEINKIDTSDNHHLAGKVYEYFIGRDASAISSLGAYFTDRHITRFIINKLIDNNVKFINDDNTIKSFCDPYGGSGGFTLSYIQKLKEMNYDIDWKNNIKKIHHYDLSKRVIKMLKLELFSLTNTFLDLNTEDVMKTNSFKYNFGKKFDIILSNPPYGGDKCEKSDEYKKTEKVINHIYSELKKYYIELKILEEDSDVATNRNLLSKKYIDEVNKIKKKTKEDDINDICDMVLLSKEQVETELNPKLDKIIEDRKKEMC